MMLLLWSLEIEDDEGMMVQTHSHASVTHELFMLLEIELPDFKVTEEGFLRVPILPDLVKPWGHDCRKPCCITILSIPCKEAITLSRPAEFGSVRVRVRLLLTRVMG